VRGTYGALRHRHADFEAAMRRLLSRTWRTTMMKLPYFDLDSVLVRHRRPGIRS
jgi:hypothetical protein